MENIMHNQTSAIGFGEKFYATIEQVQLNLVENIIQVEIYGRK